MARLVGQLVTVAVAGEVGGEGAPGGVGDADSEDGGSVGDCEGAAGGVTGGSAADDADGEGAVSGRWGCNVSAPDCWPRFVVVLRVLLQRFGVSEVLVWCWSCW